MNGHGGMRVGAGKKPTKGRFVPIEGGLCSLAEAPDNLPEDQRDFWNRWAKHAIENGTLHEGTVLGFELLCEADALKRALADTLRQQGHTFVTVKTDMDGGTHEDLKANPLVAKVLVAHKQLDSMMKNYMLTAFGKPSTSRRPKQAATSKWASVAGA